jgi:hypothetical protein
MSNPIGLKVEQGAPYTDRKKIMWLFSVIAPAGAALGPIAHKLVATSHCETSQTYPPYPPYPPYRRATLACFWQLTCRLFGLI